jgi:di/tricarboxylate transporter
VTLEIGLTLAILAIAVILFITEAIRSDVVALVVLIILALLRLVTPAEPCRGSATRPSLQSGRFSS